MRRPAGAFYADKATRAREEAIREAAIARNQQVGRDRVAAAGDAEFRELFDSTSVTTIIAAQGSEYNNVQALRENLGRDQVAWSDSALFKQVIMLYNPKDTVVSQPRGGVALSLELTHRMSGTESNKVGKAWLTKVDLWDDNVLGKMLSFNNVPYRQQMKGLTQESPPAQTPPNAEPTTSLADAITDRLGPLAVRVSLGDKMLDSMEAFPNVSENTVLRKLAWPLHTASLVSVEMMKIAQDSPVPQVEAKLTRYLIPLGLTTLGQTVAQYVGTLPQANRDRLRNVERGPLNAADQADAFKAAPNVRATVLAGLSDVSLVIIKGIQLQIKIDVRTGTELVGSILQGIGSLADQRVKAYEETVFKRTEGRNLFATPSIQATLDKLQTLQLKGLRLTAFKFLLPVVLISASFDGIDARTSGQRGNYTVMAAQIISVVGMVFTVVSTGVAVFATGNASLLAVAAILGLIDAVLTVVAVIAVLLLKEDDWITWLRDNPLSLKRKGKKPIHNNLGDTLQKLTNAQSGIQVGKNVCA